MRVVSIIYQISKALPFAGPCYVNVLIFMFLRIFRTCERIYVIRMFVLRRTYGPICTYVCDRMFVHMYAHMSAHTNICQKYMSTKISLHLRLKCGLILKISLHLSFKCRLIFVYIYFGHVRLFAHIFIHMYIYVRTYVYIRTCIYNIRTYVCIYIYIYICLQHPYI